MMTSFAERVGVERAALPPLPREPRTIADLIAQRDLYRGLLARVYDQRRGFDSWAEHVALDREIEAALGIGGDPS